MIGGAMQTSQNGIDLIKSFEGFRAKAYLDVGGVLTVGYGHTGADVPIISPITEHDAEKVLKKDLRIAEITVNGAVNGPLNQNEFDALVSLCYNIGSGHFLHSNLLFDLNHCEPREDVARHFMWWSEIRGVKSDGLVRRRKAEAELFLKAPEF
jgi:lysozyme